MACQTPNRRFSPIAYAGLSGAPLAPIDASARSWAQTVLRRARDRVPDDLPVTTIPTDRLADPRRADRPD